MPIRGDRLRWPPRPGKRFNGTRETLSTDERKPAPRQPNERDESVDSQSSAPRDVIRQAHEDVTGGQVDTDDRTRAGEVVEQNRKRRRTP